MKSCLQPPRSVGVSFPGALSVWHCPGPAVSAPGAHVPMSPVSPTAFEPRAGLWLRRHRVLELRADWKCLLSKLEMPPTSFN